MQENSAHIEPNLESAADFIVARGLEVPALFALETMRPLSAMMYHTLLLASPLETTLPHISRGLGWLKYLQEPEGIDRFLALVEDKSQQSHGLRPR